MPSDNTPQTTDQLMARVRKSHSAIRKHRAAMAEVARQAAANNQSAGSEGVNGQ